MANENHLELRNAAEYWFDLILEAQEQYVFGEPINQDLFKKCMKTTFECMVKGKEPKYQFDRFEAELYGYVYAYSQMPVVTECENSDEFKASIHAAGELAYTIMHPEAIVVEGDKIISYNYSGVEKVTYDFVSGDLADYIELAKRGYWNW